MARRWVKMYRDESRSFEQLPLVVRGLAMEFLKLTDDQGVIVIGAKTPEEAFAFALGATRSDRRAINAAVPALVSAGFFYVDGHVVRVRNFPKYQDTNHEQVTDKSRASLVQVSRNDNGPKCAETHVGTVVALREREELELERERVGAGLSPQELRRAENREAAAAMAQAIAQAPAPVVLDPEEPADALARWLRTAYRVKWAAAMGYDGAEMRLDPDPILPARGIYAAWVAHGSSAAVEACADEVLTAWFDARKGQPKRLKWRYFCGDYVDCIPPVEAV